MMNIGDSIIPWIGKTGKLVALYIDATLSTHGFDLSVKQWVLLRILARKDHFMQNDLAVLTDRDKTSLARLITTIERKGLLKRVQDPHDGRAKQVMLTKLGLMTYQSTLPIMEQAFTDIQAGFTEPEVKWMIDKLDQVQKNINDKILKSV